MAATIIIMETRIASASKKYYSFYAKSSTESVVGWRVGVFKKPWKIGDSGKVKMGSWLEPHSIALKDAGVYIFVVHSRRQKHS